MPLDSSNRYQKLRGIVEGNADPDDLRSHHVHPAALDRYRLAAVSALKADPGFKAVLERVRNAGARQIAEWTVLAQTSRVAVAMGDVHLTADFGPIPDSERLTPEVLRNAAGSFQEGNGVHQVRIVLEEFAAESDVWTDPVVAVGQFLLMLIDDYGYWLRLLEEAGCGAE